MRSPAAIQLIKEGRAIAPVVMAAAIAMALLAPPIAGQLVAPAVLGVDVGLWIYTIATVAVGALVIGHEFASGTLLSLLAQPISRARVGLWKFVVLLLGTGLLAAVASVTVFGGSRPFGALEPLRMDLLFLPLVAAVCLAPWITQLCRNTLAGTIFTIAIPAVLWIAAGIVASLVASSAPDRPLEVDAFRIAVLRVVSSIVCGAGAIAGWRSFLRLEAREPHTFVAIRAGRRSAAQAGDWTRPALRRPAIANLLVKELRIQQMTFVLAVAYVIAGVGMRMTMSPVQGRYAVDALTTGYIVLAAMLAGALAVAEDRHSGALESQLLLPVPAAWQWTIKVVVAVAVAVGVTMILPGVIGASIDMRGDRLLLLLVAAFIAGLYFSSLTNTAVRALMVAGAGAIGIGFSGALLMRLGAWIAGRLMAPLVGAPGPYDAWFPGRPWLEQALSIGIVTMLVITVLAMAYRNFRQNERSRKRIVAQIAILLSWFFVPSFGYGVAQAYYVSQYEIERSGRLLELTRIGNDRIQVLLRLPGDVYEGTRFDWAGSIASLTWHGHRYVSPWSNAAHVARQDAITSASPVEEFTNLGYDEAPVGGTFVRIGVGALRKPQESAYDPSKEYRIVETGGRDILRRPDWFTFVHILGPTNGYGYRYWKTLRVSGDTLTVEHVLENRGTKPIATTVDVVGFLNQDQPSGPDMVITLPFDVTVIGALDRVVEVRGKQIVSLKPLQTGDSFHTELGGFRSKISDFDIRVENRRTGVGVQLTSNRPMSKLTLRAQNTAVCLVPSIDLEVAPGEKTSWSLVYRFYDVSTR